MKFKKRMITKAIALILVFSLMFTFGATISSAHSSSQRGVVRGIESPFFNSGWIMHENHHTNGNLLMYRFSTTDSHIASYRTMVRQGAAMWPSRGFSVEETTSIGDRIGVFRTINDLGSTANATFRRSTSVVDANGHFLRWTVEINRAGRSNAATIGHEFGHALGLEGLTSESNRNKLMFGLSSRTVSTPQAADARTITGLHGGSLDPHNFNRFSMNPNLLSASQKDTHHHVSCSGCHGERVSGRTASHTYTIFLSVSATQHQRRCACGYTAPGGVNHVFVNNVCRDCGHRR